MAGIIAIYGLVVSVIIGVNIKPDAEYTPYKGKLNDLALARDFKFVLVL